SFFVELLPFLEEDALASKVHFELGGLFNENAPYTDTWYDIDRKAVAAAAPSCPSTNRNDQTVGGTISSGVVTTAAVGSYAGCEGTKSWIKDGADPGYFLNNGLFVYKLRKKLKQVTDGTSSTFAIGEVISEDTPSGYNAWPWAFRDGSALRNTVNAVNTPI